MRISHLTANGRDSEIGEERDGSQEHHMMRPTGNESSGTKLEISRAAWIGFGIGMVSLER